MKKNIDLIIDGIAPEKVMYDTDNHSLVVLYPAQKEFKKGDILASDNKTLLIFDGYANKEKDLLHSLWNNTGISNINWQTKAFKHATDEQIVQLHEELREEGKKWNKEALEVKDLDISDIVVGWRSACEYLDKPEPDFSSLLVSLPSEDYHKYKAQITLQLIREAWNKHDGFVIDWDDYGQAKYYPILDFDGSIKYYTATESSHISASCYSFKTKERAIQFGTLHKELFKTAMGM